MTINPQEQKEKITNKFKLLSDKYHRLSLLFYELSESLRIKGKRQSLKEFKSSIKELDLDLDKIMKLSNSISDLKLSDLKKEKKEE